MLTSLVLSLVAVGPGPAAEGSSSDAGTVEASSFWLSTVQVHAGVEVGLSSFPSGTPAGGQDVLGELQPIFGLEAGPSFALEVGANLRLRLVDDGSRQRPEDFGGLLRRRDWDEASDFGQLIRSLEIGDAQSVVRVSAGPVRNKTLGLGHLVSRYSNQDNADYHPAAASAVVAYQAFHGELFASDVFGARLFAGELALDLLRLLSPKYPDRLHLAASLAHDFGLAGGVTPDATLLQLDFDLLLVRSSALRLMAFAGGGARVQGTTDLGFEAGLSLDSEISGAFSLGVKFEVRKHSGGFRPAFFGPGYELSRFAATGLSGPALASQSLPNSFGFYGELHVASGTAASLDFALEYFAWGRTDADLLGSLELIEHRLVASARFTVIGVGTSRIEGMGAGVFAPRYDLRTELRLRLLASFYVLAHGGTVFFPQPDQTLVRGVTAGAGVGFDFER